MSYLFQAIFAFTPIFLKKMPFLLMLKVFVQQARSEVVVAFQEQTTLSSTTTTTIALKSHQCDGV